MRALSLLAVLVALAVLAYGSEVYVFKVWLPQPYSGFGIYVPGVKWGLGEAAWLFMAPVERGEAVYALTGNITEVKLYDARAVYIAIPATKPAKVAKADAWLETAVGRYPVRIKESHSTMLTLVDSEEEVYKVLREAGYSPKYMGEATLVEAEGRLPEPLRPEPLTPSTSLTYRAYGGVYFIPTAVSAGTTVVIKPHAQSSIRVCGNVPDAAFVGYDAEAMTLGVYILGGSVRGRIGVEVYAIEGIDMWAPCKRLGPPLEFELRNKTYIPVLYVNASASRDKPLAVRVYVYADSVSGSPRVSVNASVTYSRTYRYGFEMSEYMTYTRSVLYTINQRVSRVVFGPYLIPDGIATGRHEVSFAITTEPESGTCPPITADWFINGVWVNSRDFYSTGRTSAGCGYTITFTQNGLEAAGVLYAKPFAGAFYYVVRLRYAGGGTPYIKNIQVLNHEALRGWRWAEVWRTTPSSGPSIDWREPFTASEVQMLYTVHQVHSSDTIGPTVLVHGVFSLRNVNPSSGEFFQVTVAGGTYAGGERRPLSSFSITMRFSSDVGGARVSRAYYATPAGVEKIEEPIWVYYGKMIKTAVDFGITFLNLGLRASLLYQALSFGVDKALETAVTQPTASTPDSNTITISWTKGWADDKPSDKVHVFIELPAEKRRISSVTTVTVIELKLEYVPYTPNLQWYIHPTSDGAYTREAPQQPPYKIWMFGGLTEIGEIYQTK